MEYSPDLDVTATGGEHFMRNVKDICRARSEETSEGKFETISNLLLGKREKGSSKLRNSLPKRTAAQKRRISGNGAMLLMEGMGNLSQSNKK
jgi:hypothetical protein